MQTSITTICLKPGIFPDFENLWNVPFPPKEIHVRGSEQALTLLSRLPEHGLAIVGTRRPQPRSLHLIDAWVKELRHTDLIIISGLASGIDTAAHQAALDAGLPTIAILGCGFDHLYPRENRALSEEILRSNGLVVSEFSTATKPLPGYFIHRNRLIANWAKATWVVEAGFRSGALNTAKWARLSDRHCFATPGFPGDPSLAGNQLLLERDQSHPLWGPQSLGTAWLELSSLGQKAAKLNAVPVQGLTSDECLLMKHVHQLTVQNGGAAVSELLNWALEQHWEPARFFISLRLGLDSGRLCERNGTILAVARPHL